MTATPSLFGECPLPGCINLVDDPRWPCGDCEAALAGYIRPSAQQATAEEATAMLAERDSALLGLRGASHLPTRPGPPRPLDMQDMRGDHVTATTAEVLRGVPVTRPRARPRFCPFSVYMLGKLACTR